MFLRGMDKIASPQELASQLRHLLAYAQSPKPSRVKLAADLKRLARQVVIDEEAWLLADDAKETLGDLRSLQEGIDDLADIYRDTPWKKRKLDVVRRDTQDAARSVHDIQRELEILGGR